MRISDWSSDVCSSDLFEHRDRRGPHARGALREARELEREHQAHHRQRHRITDPGGMAEYDVALEHFQLVVADPDARQFPEAGIDPIVRFMPAEDARSEERRVGIACVSACRSRWSPYH